jgi:hypothetical protein
MNYKCLLSAELKEDVEVTKLLTKFSQNGSISTILFSYLEYLFSLSVV